MGGVQAFQSRDLHVVRLEAGDMPQSLRLYAIAGGDKNHPAPVLIKAGLTRSYTDPCIYYKHSRKEPVIGSIYVDDCIVPGATNELINITY